MDRTTDYTSSDRESQHESGAGFLRDQLEALRELRADGHFSDIVFFAQRGWRDAVKLRAASPDGVRPLASQLTAQYRELVLSLSH